MTTTSKGRGWKAALLGTAAALGVVAAVAGVKALQIATLGLVFILLATLSDGMYALAAGSAAGWLRGRSGFVHGERYATGGVLVGLGLLAAFSGAKSNH